MTPLVWKMAVVATIVHASVASAQQSSAVRSWTNGSYDKNIQRKLTVVTDRTTKPLPPVVRGPGLQTPMIASPFSTTRVAGVGT